MAFLDKLKTSDISVVNYYVAFLTIVKIYIDASITKLLVHLNNFDSPTMFLNCDLATLDKWTN